MTLYVFVGSGFCNLTDLSARAQTGETTFHNYILTLLEAERSKVLVQYKYGNKKYD